MLLDLESSEYAALMYLTDIRRLEFIKIKAAVLV